VGAEMERGGVPQAGKVWKNSGIEKAREKGWDFLNGFYLGFNTGGGV